MLIIKQLLPLLLASWVHIVLQPCPLVTSVGATSVSINILYTIVDHKTAITSLFSKLSTCRSVPRPLTTITSHLSLVHVDLLIYPVIPVGTFFITNTS